MKYNKGRGLGFTMVEVMVSCAMVALIGLAVYSSLNNGITAWTRVQAALPEGDAVLFFDKFFRDVTNSYRYPNMSFRGNQTFFSFPTIVRDGGRGNEPVDTLGRCEYFFNEEDTSLERSQFTYSDIYGGRQEVAMPVVTSVSAVAFSYYFFDQNNGEHAWSNTWPPEEGQPENVDLPLAVRVVLSLVGNDKTYDYKKTIFLPMAN